MLHIPRKTILFMLGSGSYIEKNTRSGRHAPNAL